MQASGDRGHRQSRRGLQSRLSGQVTALCNAQAFYCAVDMHCAAMLGSLCWAIVLCAKLSALLKMGCAYRPPFGLSQRPLQWPEGADNNPYSNAVRSCCAWDADSSMIGMHVHPCAAAAAAAAAVQACC